jgi:ABC-type Zn2+ transport system substrate-binding protein/surface adhesin
MEPFFISTKTVPSDQKLEELKEHIREMTVSCLSNQSQF